MVDKALEYRGPEDSARFRKVRSLAGKFGGTENFDKWTPDEQIQIAMMGRSDLMKEGVEKFTQNLPSLTKEAGASIAGILGGAQTRLAGITGYSGPGVNEIYQGLMANRSGGAGREVVVGRRYRYEPIDGNPLQRRRVEEEAQSIVGAGQYTVGQKMGSGYTIVRIDKLEVKANDVRRLQNEIMLAGGRPRLAMGTT